nr:cytochrome c oxidase subunit II [Denitromonas sp.]
MSVLARFAVTALSAVPAVGAWAAQSSVNLQTPVTAVATEIYDMHTLMMIICLVIFVAVFGVMFW